jgi:hypothetical protein
MRTLRSADLPYREKRVGLIICSKPIRHLLDITKNHAVI